MASASERRVRLRRRAMGRDADFTTLRVSGSSERIAPVVRARYPNEEFWYIVSVAEIRAVAFPQVTRY